MELLFMYLLQDLVKLAAFFGVRQVREWFVDVHKPIESHETCIVSVPVHVLAQSKDWKKGKLT